MPAPDWFMSRLDATDSFAADRWLCGCCGSGVSGSSATADRVLVGLMLNDGRSYTKSLIFNLRFNKSLYITEDF